MIGIKGRLRRLQETRKSDSKHFMRSPPTGHCPGGSREPPPALWRLALFGRSPMKRSILALVAFLAFGLFSASFVHGEDAAKKEAKTVSGTSACATCDGVTKAEHQIMIVDKDGQRWVLVGDSESYKKAHKVRMDGKKMTAKL